MVAEHIIELYSCFIKSQVPWQLLKVCIHLFKRSFIYILTNFNLGGFTPIVSIFYSAFHPTEGTKVYCQVPPGSIVPEVNSKDTSTFETPLFNFDQVKSYVIPKPELCNRLVTFKVDKYRVIGFPVMIRDPAYPRNEYFFNFAFVFKYRGLSIVYETSIRRLARMFTALEEQSKFLSNRSSHATIDSLLQQIYQDLNYYSECMIPIDESNTVNMKLFPLFPPPPELKPYQVPISTVQLEAMVDVNWDPTMVKIIKYIDGINSVRRIADLADADYDLVKKCIQHLMHYSCVTIIDLFQFSNIYAPTSNVSDLINKPEMRVECQRYVYNHALPTQRYTGPLTSASIAAASASPSSFSSLYSAHRPASQAYQINSYTKLYELYLKLNQGITIREWFKENQSDLRYIDVRRFLTFGVIKGVIYRVHSYPIQRSLSPEFTYLNKSLKIAKPQSDQHFNQHATSSYPQIDSRFDVRRSSILNQKSYTATSSSHGSGENSYPSNSSSYNNNLNGYKDKFALEVEDMISSIIHEPRHYDAICTDMRKPKEEVAKILRNYGEWNVLNC